MKTIITEAFKARLISLGFDHAINIRIGAYLCFNPQQLELSHAISVDDAKCFFSVQCVKGDQEMYDALSYTASLVKFPVLSNEEISVHKRLSAVDWNQFYFIREHAEVGDSTNTVGLINELIASDTTGILRFRHWIGTSLETYIPNLSTFKLEYEISQRFYLLSQQEPITFTEAMRFLQSKWTERKMMMDRRELLKQKDSAGTGAAGKLLTKRVRPNRKPGGYNK